MEISKVIVNAPGILQYSSPYPFVAEGALRDGIIHEQLNICRKCQKKDCGDLAGQSFGHFTCSKGFSCYPMAAFGSRFVLNGLIASDANQQIIGKRRKPYKANIVTHDEILKFKDNIARLDNSVADAVADEVKGSLAYLHDIRTSVGIVLSWCQEVIGAGDGISFEEKLKAAPDELVGLFQSINLLTEQLNLADIIPNPAAIKYGAKGRSSIHGFLYKMFKLFEPRFRRKGRKIELQGSSRAKIEAYNSIQFIPLILLDNALKYSAADKTTYIALHDIKPQNLVEVRISSYGRIVPDHFSDKIFEKYVRGPGAEQMNPQGMGLGLYIAQEIAVAHNFKLHYKSTSTDGLSGSNDFYFQIRTCAYES